MKTWRRRPLSRMAIFLTLLGAGILSCKASAEENGATGTPGNETVRPGYQRVAVDLGDRSLDLSVIVPQGSTITQRTEPLDIKAPGRVEIARISGPDRSNDFDTTILVFKPGFAAEAPAVAEQVLMEGHYATAGTAHTSLTSADASGRKTLENGHDALARAICRTRGDMVICLLMTAGRVPAGVFAERSAILAGSLRFERAEPDGFAADQLARVSLPLGSNRTQELVYPSAWTIESNEFAGGLPATLQMVHGGEADPLSVMVVTASAGPPPASADAIDDIARAMVDRWIVANDSLFQNAVLATQGDIAGLPTSAIGRSFVYVVDKRAGNKGKAQIRLTLIAAHGHRYAILMATHYSPKIDETGPFFNRLSGATAYDLAMQSLFQEIR